MLSTLIQALRLGGITVDSENLADTLWLAQIMGCDDAVTVDSSTNNAHIASKETLGESKGQIRSTNTDFGLEPAKPNIPASRRNTAPLSPSVSGTQGNETVPLGALPALENRVGFKRAIKPFLAQHRKASDRLDESATLKRLTPEGLQALQPIFLPGSRRSLRLSLVRERMGSNALWTQPLDELAELFRSQGVFRQQREWSLSEKAKTDQDDIDAPTTACLCELTKYGAAIGSSRTAAEMKWWPQEIVVIASDFTSAGWWNGTYLTLLRSWAAQQPVVLLHTLPKRLWSRSWTGLPDAWVTNAKPLVATKAMEVRLQLHGQRPLRDDSRLAIPLIEFEPQALKTWVKGIMGVADKIAAVLLEEREYEQGTIDPHQVDAKILSTHFRMASSPMARQLAHYMSVTAPLSFPVMRWVQQAMLPQSDSSHLAEFVLGGLLESLPSSSAVPADGVIYDFVEGIRPLLQQGMPKIQGLEVQSVVGGYLEHKHSDQLDMRAVVETWSDERIRTLSPELKSFAVVSRDFLARIGLRPQGLIKETKFEVEHHPSEAKKADTQFTVQQTQPNIEDKFRPSSIAEKPVFYPDIEFSKVVDVDTRDWLFDMKARVLVAQIPINGRVGQVNFSLATFENFFGGVRGDNSKRIILRAISVTGKLGPIEHRPHISVVSKNFRLELSAGAGLKYPKEGRPVGVYIRVSVNMFLYYLLMPDTPGFNDVTKWLDKAWIGPKREMKRVETSVEHFREVLSGLPLIVMLDG